MADTNIIEGPPCPWRLGLSNGNEYSCAKMTVPHDVHTNLPDASPYDVNRKTWTRNNAGAYRVDEAPLLPVAPEGLREVEPLEAPDRPRTRTTPVDGSCANLTCPNRAGEGRFTLMTVHTSQARAARDVVLILCAPCAEYLGRMVR